MGLLFLFRGDHDDHPPPFHLGKAFCSAIFFQFLEHFQQKELPPFLKYDGPAPEGDISLDFGAVFQEFGGVLDLEIKVMVVGIRPETDLFDDRFGGIGLDFLFFLPLVIEELIEFDDATDGRIGIGGNHDQVLAHIFSPALNHTGIIDPGFYGFACYGADFIQILSYQPDLGYPNISIDLELKLIVVLSGGVGWKSICQMVKTLG